MKEICRFFGVQQSHELKWAHGINTDEQLSACCAADDVMMVEGDVVMTPFTSIPMMASPFQVDGQLQPGNLPFEQWLATLGTHHKGGKIDIQTPETLEPVLAILATEQPEIPLVLHADVFNLLGVEESNGFEPEMFIQLAQRYWPSAVLSLGWSLKREQDPNGTMENIIIEQMADLILERLGGLAYTIEIRAGYTSGWEKGAAFIFEPKDGVSRPVYGDNVIDGIAHFRSHLFAVNE
jgi:hypothetical protein